MDPNNWQKIKVAFNQWLELPDADRQRFIAELSDPTRGEVEKLVANYEKAADFIESPAALSLGAGESNDANAGRRIDDYEIIELIGTGGMGNVYLAEQRADGLTHRVALKLIKRGMDTTSVLSRFVRERQILANLEHPNIARFLDGGSTADGVPYFVMEYVEGLPIRKFCEERELDVASRLVLFRKVCAAVSFAHQNLTVHRDLKPSNILVTPDAEPKLLDFGIAKLLNPDWSEDTAEMTATMFRVMTPEYASPEQLRGESVTTASDVYSLGVVLYELLTGQRPYRLKDHSPDEVARQVLTEDPVKPSSAVLSRPPSLNATDTGGAPSTKAEQQVFEISANRSAKALRGDLDNIILKALQKEPSRRYQSAQELSEDIRRHLEGLPVTATADSFSYRAAKFLRRHRGGVAAAAAVVLVLLAASTITAWQAYRAERERVRAEQRFNDVRRLTNAFMFDFHDAIAELPGSTAARSLVVSKALEYLEILAAENVSDPTLNYELGSAFGKIGRIQGSGSDASLGDTTAAMKSYGRARDLLEPLVAAEPANVAYVEALAQNYLDMTVVAAQRGEIEDFLAANKRATELYERLIELSPERTELRATVSDAYKSHGDYISSRGDLEASLAYYRKAAAATRSALELKPDDEYAMSRQLVADEAIAATLGNPNYTNLGQVAESAELYRQMLTITQSRLNKKPDDRYLRANHAYFLENYGLLLGEAGNWKAALEKHDEALGIQRPLADADRNNAVARWRMANMLTDRGQALAKLGRFPESLSSHRQAIAIYDEVVQKDPDNGQMRLNQARSIQRYADALAESGQFDAARAEYEKAVAINQGMADEDPENMDVRWALAADYAKLGRLLLARTNSAQSGELREGALQNLRRSREVYLLMRDKGLNIKPINDSIELLGREISATAS